MNKSVFYTHHFYKKIARDDGSVVAKCNVCWENNKNKEVFIKVSEDEDISIFTVLYSNSGHRFQH